MKTVYRSYTKNMAFTILVMAFLASSFVLAVLGIFQMEETDWGRIICWIIYILVLNGYSIYLVTRGGVKVDSETGIMTVVPGRQQIPIDRIQVLEIMTSKIGRIKRMNIRFSPTHFTTIYVANAEGLISQLCGMNPNIKIERKRIIGV